MVPEETLLHNVESALAAVAVALLPVNGRDEYTSNLRALGIALH